MPYFSQQKNIVCKIISVFVFLGAISRESYATFKRLHVFIDICQAVLRAYWNISCYAIYRGNCRLHNRDYAIVMQSTEVIHS